MKKWIKLGCLALVLMMTASAAALADTTANATVECDKLYDVTAPFSGIVGSFDWKAGSEVKQGDTLYTLDTVKVYAPIDGTLRALFAPQGGDADGAMLEYGAIAAIEPSSLLRVNATISGAADKKENQLIRVGESVYFKNIEDKVIDGEGRVIYADAAGYAIEVTKGEYKLGTRVKIYRDSEYASDSAIGTGSVSRAGNVMVQGTGRVLRCYAAEGQAVKQGDLLFELITGNPDPSVASADVTAPIADVVGQSQVMSGQQVYRGQLMTAVYDMTSLRVVAQVDEIDLDKLAVGDSVEVELDRYPGEKLYGTVELIQKLGTPKQNATYYSVRISVATNKELLPGMNATVFLPDEKAGR